MILPPDRNILPKSTEMPDRPNDAIEQYWRGMGYQNIAGVDEAGRGPLAGPVVVAAVILNPSLDLMGLNDSKKLTQRARETLFEEIINSAKAISIVAHSAEHIDRDNIRQATLDGMAKAVRSLSIQPDFVLIDGRDIPEPLKGRAEAYIKGDGRSKTIAAASIVAKTIRDRMMLALDDPHYGFKRHKGYGSQFHRDAIEELGGVPRIHRFTFAPLKNREA